MTQTFKDHSKIHFEKILVVALKPEWSFLKNKYRWQKTVQDHPLFTTPQFNNAALLQTGPGPENARKTFENFLKNFSCQKVLQFGTCGALVSRFKAGDLVHDHFLTVSKPLKNFAEKKMAAEKHDALAVEMENAPIAEICGLYKIAYATVRGVFDTLEDNLEDMGEPYSQDGELSPMQLTLNLLKKPKLITQLPEFKKRMDLIGKNLSGIVEEFLLKP